MNSSHHPQRQRSSTSQNCSNSSFSRFLVPQFIKKSRLHEPSFSRRPLREPGIFFSEHPRLCANSCIVQQQVLFSKADRSGIPNTPFHPRGQTTGFHLFSCNREAGALPGPSRSPPYSMTFDHLSQDSGHSHSRSVRGNIVTLRLSLPVWHGVRC